MNIVWKQGLSYQDNYDNLLEKLKEDNKEWNTSEPPQDGSLLFFKCADSSYNNEYDIGYWQDYTQREDYLKGWTDLEGEWNTEFGNCVEIIGWKYVGEFKWTTKLLITHLLNFGLLPRLMLRTSIQKIMSFMQAFGNFLRACKHYNVG